MSSLTKYSPPEDCRLFTSWPERYNAEALAAELAGCFNGTPVIPPSLATAAPTAAVHNSAQPVSPNCGVPMLQRTASKGANRGKQFWGCPNYPKCREVVAGEVGEL